MPTINAMVNHANMVARVSTKYFGSNFQAANNSVLVGPGFQNFFNYLKSDFGGQPALTTLIENYTNNRDSFSELLQENLDSLRESAEKVRESAQAENAETAENVEEVVDTDNDNNTGSSLSTLREFAADNIPPEQRNAPPPPERNIRQEQTNSLQDFAREYLTAEKIVADATAFSNSNDNGRITEVRDLVRDFNSAMSYLQENRGISNRMGALADQFGNNRNLTESLNRIGISVDTQGFLAVNEATLNSALNNNSTSVNNILGSEGLAGQLDRNINLANYQGDRLFTSIVDFANQRQQDDAESLYGNNANYARENTPQIFAMLT